MTGTSARLQRTTSEWRSERNKKYPEMINGFDKRIDNISLAASGRESLKSRVAPDNQFT